MRPGDEIADGMKSEKELAASYRDRAKQLREIAELDGDDKTASTLRNIAAQYEKMGDSLATLDAKRTKRRPS